ncbi:MAG: aminoacyl-tRNA hydrolase, partial [Alphaproteobacteria bacterium]|nr:aminoacyl-tRNA hydrolase [Alphaproteobacteria bacterium]
MLLLVGLGNPGAGYSENRHNIGFMAADEIVRRHSFVSFRKKFQGEISEGTIDGEKVLILKPQTFMNESGRSVGEVIRFYKIELENVIVLYDELDLPLGKLKVKTGGGAGGHNGIRSIDAHVGKDYRRVRLGIGHPGHKDKVHGHVLSDFAKSERPAVEKLIDEVACQIGHLIKGNDANFMNKVALGLQPAKPEKLKKKVEEKSKPKPETP